MGGVVYRVVGVSGRTRTLKVYQSERDAALDLHRLNALRRLLSEKAPTDSDRFKVARARLISPKVLQIQNVYGMTLQDVFDNLYLPLALKNELEWKYEQSLEHLQGLLKETYRSASLSYNGWFVVTREDHDALGFLLKYDNIIVTPNKNLVIVDPY